MPDTILKKWIKTKKGRKGLVVGTVLNGSIKVGWSLCHRTDKFDKDLAHDLAFGRILNKKSDAPPESIASAVVHMEDRCQRYFNKGSN